MIDRTQEKIQLADELGMQEWVDARQDELIAIKAMTSLKFKKITFTQIQKKLRRWTWSWGSSMQCFGVVLVLFGMAIIGLFHFFPQQLGLDVVFANGLGHTLLWLGALFQLFGFSPTRVHHKSLTSWTDNIPYGALLSVKEAKEQGLHNFKIYYPVRDERRLLDDPIITGEHPDVKGEFEVFAWDDGKVYE